VRGQKTHEYTFKRAIGKEISKINRILDQKVTDTARSFHRQDISIIISIKSTVALCRRTTSIASECLNRLHVLNLLVGPTLCMDNGCVHRFLDGPLCRGRPRHFRRRGGGHQQPGRVWLRRRGWSPPSRWYLPVQQQHAPFRGMDRFRHSVAYCMMQGTDTEWVCCCLRLVRDRRRTRRPTAAAALHPVDDAKVTEEYDLARRDLLLLPSAASLGSGWPRPWRHAAAESVAFAGRAWLRAS
jgi:hypothetical protein